MMDLRFPPPEIVKEWGFRVEKELEICVAKWGPSDEAIIVTDDPEPFVFRTLRLRKEVENSRIPGEIVGQTAAANDQFWGSDKSSNERKRRRQPLRPSN
jgi:hypothetical protein